MKNCDQGFQNVAQGCLRPKPANNKFFFLQKSGFTITNGFVYATLVIEFACVPSLNSGTRYPRIIEQ